MDVFQGQLVPHLHLHFWLTLSKLAICGFKDSIDRNIFPEMRSFFLGIWLILPFLQAWEGFFYLWFREIGNDLK